jgi:hypothetical protein
MWQVVEHRLAPEVLSRAIGTTPSLSVRHRVSAALVSSRLDITPPPWSIFWATTLPRHCVVVHGRAPRGSYRRPSSRRPSPLMSRALCVIAAPERPLRALCAPCGRQDFASGQGTDFDRVGTSQMVIICESLRESSVWRVGQVLFLAGCISIRVTAALSVMSDSLSLQSFRSMLGVLLMDSMT